jgi:hypothetical protein
MPLFNNTIAVVQDLLRTSQLTFITMETRLFFSLKKSICFQYISSTHYPIHKITLVSLFNTSMIVKKRVLGLPSFIQTTYIKSLGSIYTRGAWDLSPSHRDKRTVLTVPATVCTGQHKFIFTNIF